MLEGYNFLVCLRVREELGVGCDKINGLSHDIVDQNKTIKKSCDQKFENQR